MTKNWKSDEDQVYQKGYKSCLKLTTHSFVNVDIPFVCARIWMFHGIWLSHCDLHCPTFFIVLVRSFPPLPGGYSQWQPQKAARREEKCRASRTN